LSIPAESEPYSVERFHWAVRLSPLFVSVVLAVLWLSGKPRPIPDLRLSAPVVARPGDTIGLRSWQLDEDDLGRVSVLAPSVRIELRDDAGQVRAETTLARSRVEGREGRLEVPAALDGKYTLVALAEIDGREVEVDRALYVRESIDSKLEAGRTINAFQAYTLEPLQRLDKERAPSVLDPRIEEGACTPDLPCTLVVWVGDWEGLLQARPLTGARIDADRVRTEGGFARFPVTVTGPEARVAIHAVDAAGSVLAERNVRLPLVPGGMTASAETRGDDVELEWQSLGEAGPVLVDVFDEHRWVDALSLSPREPGIRGFSPGVWRLQVRRDLFSGNTGAVAFVVIPDEAPAASMAADFVLSMAHEEGLDPLAMSVVGGEFVGDPDAAVAALLAIPSFDVVELGNGVSARIDVDESTAEVQESRRIRAAVLILLVGVFVSLVLWRLEVLAQERANRVLESLASGDATGTPPPASGRGLWAFVLFVFVVIAVLALSKGWF
jgi:hypothetical protein